jgi:hypothetical protein
LSLDRFKSSAPSPISKTWARRYPPIAVALAMAMLIAVVVLPSALNIPQTNPTTVAEYAPVPPEDDSPPDTQGNVSALGLGTSSSLQRGLPIGSDTTTGPTEGQRRIQKRCVGKPARQTEDPMAPPCVPIFEGNNGGATWGGVTKDEIRVVVYSLYGSSSGSNRSVHCTTISPTATCSPGPRPRSLCDLDKPPNTDPGCVEPDSNQDFWFTKITRAYGRHFDLRYQTYGRHVHFYIWFAASTNPQAQRADAAEAFERVKPFASLGFNNHWTDAMAARKVLSFGGGAGGFQQASLFTRNAPYLWGFGPSIEYWVNAYADYVCTKLPGTTVSHADGNDIDGRPLVGQSRRYAFMYTTEATEPGLLKFRELVKPKLADCGITPAVEVDFPVAGPIDYAGGPASEQAYPQQNVAEMRQARVNTILWFGGLETKTGRAAREQQWFPEIVFVSDGGNLDGFYGGDAQDQTWWGNSYGITEALYQGTSLEEAPGFQACKEGDPGVTRDECQYGVDWEYRNHFLLFKGIQAAGPRLTPSSVDRGMHSLPSITSTNPMLASCHFDPGDFTCVKDRVEIWWDPNADNPFHEESGCQRMNSGAKRFLPGTWPREDTVMQNDKDPCGPTMGSAFVTVVNP